MYMTSCVYLKSGFARTGMSPEPHPQSGVELIARAITRAQRTLTRCAAYEQGRHSHLYMLRGDNAAQELQFERAPSASKLNNAARALKSRWTSLGDPR